MANTLLTPSIITNEALRILHNELTFSKQINREYDERFAKSGAKIGSTLQVRRPVQFTVRSGSTLSTQDVVETKKDLTVATQIGIDWEFSDADLTMTIDNFSDRYLKPAAARLATELDYRALGMYKQVHNQVGTPGTTPATSSVYLQAGAKLDHNACPRDGRRYINMEAEANAATVAGLQGLFNAQGRIADQYTKGLMGRDTLGFDFYMDQNINRHSVGPLGGTPLVNGAGQGVSSGYAETSSLVTDGWTASAANRLKEGDVFTIAGVYSVNPETKQSTGQLQQFVVRADTNSDGSGNATVTISPAIITGGAYQTVTNAPADNAAITVSGTASTAYPINMAFHKDAFTLVTADMELPGGMDMAQRASSDGISLRFVRGYDINADKRVCRFDLLFGMVAIRPEWACRIIG